MGYAANRMVAIVDENRRTREDTLRLLCRQGYAAVAYGGFAALAASPAYHMADLIVLAPSAGPAALADCRRHRAAGGPAIVAVVSPGDVNACADCLEAGADDCLTSPCNLLELAARIRAVLRRLPRGWDGPAQIPDRVTFAGWRLDLASRQLTRPDGAPVRLTGGEFDLLVAFLRQPRRPLSADQLLAWTRIRTETAPQMAIRAQLCRLRDKLGDPRDGTGLIQTVRGDGYVFSARVQPLSPDGIETSLR